jgi:hypothetical protein
MFNTANIKALVKHHPEPSILTPPPPTILITNLPKINLDVILPSPSRYYIWTFSKSTPPLRLQILYRPSYPAHVILLDFAVLTIIGDVYKSRNSFIHEFLNSSLTSSLLGTFF